MCAIDSSAELQKIFALRAQKVYRRAQPMRPAPEVPELRLQAVVSQGALSEINKPCVGGVVVSGYRFPLLIRCYDVNILQGSPECLMWYCL